MNPRLEQRCYWVWKCPKCNSQTYEDEESYFCQKCDWEEFK